MKILIIGGTLFLGKHITKRALEKGYEVTLFNRGMRNPDIFQDAERIKGDRDKDIDLLRNRKWDAVIDTCGYIPRIVEKSAEILSCNAGKYVFISTISVYKDFSKTGITEGSELSKLENESDETLNNETYGPLKTHCEERVKKYFPENHLIIRPGLIVGADDYTDRFTYWPVRIRRGGNTVIPESTEYPIQFIDVRDLADFTITMTEQKAAGTFNAAGPREEYTFQNLLDACVPHAKQQVEFIRLPEGILEEKLNAAGQYLPMSEAKGEWAGIEQINCSKAISAGLTFRDVSVTVKDTIDWFSSMPAGYVMKAGLTEEAEKKIIGDIE
jgi:2'-hydroxyisoflavone reductase